MATIIPAPAGSAMVEAAAHRSLLVRVDGVDVVVTDDMARWKFTVSARGRLSCLDLNAALRSGEQLGESVVIAEAGCGGGLADEESFKVVGSPEQVRAVFVAIPYFYEGERDVEARKMLRAVYHRLAKVVT